VHNSCPLSVNCGNVLSAVPLCTYCYHNLHCGCLGEIVPRSLRNSATCCATVRYAFPLLFADNFYFALYECIISCCAGLLEVYLVARRIMVEMKAVCAYKLFYSQLHLDDDYFWLYWSSFGMVRRQCWYHHWEENPSIFAVIHIFWLSSARVNYSNQIIWGPIYKTS